MAAINGELDHWADNPEGALALVIVLDQFSRNMFRNDPQAFARDPAALKFTKKALESGFDQRVDENIKAFFYLPLMHSENIEDQKACLAAMTRLGSKSHIDAAREHLEIIEQFGRFPHRNQLLGRETSAEEQAFLDAGGFAG